MSNPGQSPPGFPQLGADFVDDEKKITFPWYRLLIALWQLAGGSQIPIFQAVFFKQISQGVINAYDTSLGGLIGTLRLKNQPGATEVLQTLVASPFIFSAPGDGFFTAFSCEIELARSSGFYKVSLNGGAVPMTKDDQVRLTWLGPTPVAVWWPSG